MRYHGKKRFSLQCCGQMMFAAKSDVATDVGDHQRLANDLITNAFQTLPNGFALADVITIPRDDFVRKSLASAAH